MESRKEWHGKRKGKASFPWWELLGSKVGRREKPFAWKSFTREGLHGLGGVGFC